MGTVRECHKLGGHGRAYEVIADGETLPDEITEAELAPFVDTLQELLTRMRDVHPESLPASLADLRSAWLKAGCPGLNK